MAQGQITRRGGALKDATQIVNYTMLYDAGDECLELTGGWNAYAYTNNNDVSGYQRVQPTLTKNTYSMTLEQTKQTAGVISIGAMFTEKPIKMDGYAQLFYHVQTSDTFGIKNSGWVQFGLSETKSDLFVRLCGSHYANSSGFPNFGLFQPYGIPSTSEFFLYVSLGAEYGGPVRLVGIDGIFLVKNDNWSNVASIAGVTASSISALLSYSSTILNNEDAVKFMLKNCTGDFMIEAVTNSTFLSALSGSPYKEKVYANEHWAKFLAMVA